MKSIVLLAVFVVVAAPACAQERLRLPRTDLQEARLAHQRHVIELAQSRAQFLTNLGVTLL